MRTRLKVGLLAAAIACGAFVAAKAAEEKSYLPPAWFQNKGETTVPKTTRPAKTVQAKRVRHASHVRKRHVAALHHHRRVRVAHHRRYYRLAYQPSYYRYRYAYYRPAFPGFMFGLFNW